VGRVDALAARAPAPDGIALAVGHTRWATHGKPTEENAHPHQSADGRIALVHNGIIENFAQLRQMLEADGVVFQSQTDSEAVAHLVAKHYDGDLVAAVEATIAQLDGTFALGVVAVDQPDLIVGARRGSPLAVGIADGAAILASDAMPILPFTKRTIFLEDDQVAVLRANEVVIRHNGAPVEVAPVEIDWDAEAAEMGGYPHFMLKEIHEQPAMLEKLVRTRILDPGQSGAGGAKPRFDLDGIHFGPDYVRDISRVVLVAQGTAYHAAMVGRNMLERVMRVPCAAEYASDFRYRDPILDPSVLVIAITQSGETLDTLEGLRLARQQGCRVLAVVNVVGSSIAREADDVFQMHMGPEIGVASTKAFTGMIASLYLVAIHLGLTRGTLSAAEARRRVADLSGIGPRCEAVLGTEPYIRRIALKYTEAQNALFLGRGTGWPIAMEGALKLKEVSYNHAEGYNAAEMKHGPIALIDENMPVVVIALKGRRYEMILGNVQEVKARGGRVLAIASHDDDYIETLADDVIYIRAENGIMNSILCSLPLQLLAYHIAAARGCDVDKPKNLAKSVTVK
ncbi:MAG: glutamine--fructose-6-phosphate transaminase (isomerizing), partial [Planctomycetota bacterium]